MQWFIASSNLSSQILLAFIRSLITNQNSGFKSGNANFNFILNRNNEDFKMELISDKKINLHITFLSDILNGRHYLWNDNIESNSWKTFKVFSKKNVEIRVFLEDNQIPNYNELKRGILAIKSLIRL